MRSRGSNSGRSWGRAPRAASTSAWAGLCARRCLVRLASSTSERCHTPWVEWTQCPSSTLRFAQAVQTIAGARPLARAWSSRASAARRGWSACCGRSSAGTAGATIAVVVRGRPWPAVQADLIEGVVAANGLVPPDSDRARAELWLALEGAPAEEEAAA